MSEKHLISSKRVRKLKDKKDSRLIKEKPIKPVNKSVKTNKHAKYTAVIDDVVIDIRDVKSVLIVISEKLD